jgi:hypothetical protein
MQSGIRALLAGWACLAAVLIAIALLLSSSARVVRCDAALGELPEPSGWRSWPVVPGLAGYTVVDLEPYRYPGYTSWRPHGLTKPRLTGRGVCPERGASLDSWFGLYDSYRRLPEELRVRRSPTSDVLAVTGQVDLYMDHPLGDETFVVAFRPIRDAWLTRALPLAPQLLLAVLSLLATLVGLRVAHRELGRARDAKKPGYDEHQRDPALDLELEDGWMPVSAALAHQRRAARAIRRMLLTVALLAVIGLIARAYGAQ